MAAETAQPSFLATRRGKLTLALLCAVAFLDFVDASIVNIALPSIRRALHFSDGDLQWVPSAYLLTYGGFMLLGGRAADLLGRRRVLIAGVTVIGISSLIGGLAESSGVLDRRASRAGTRRRDDAPRRALDPDHQLQGGQGAEHRTGSLGRRSPGSPPRSACCSAAC